MPTRTLLIRQWGSDETCWISHECFATILQRLRRRWTKSDQDPMEISVDWTQEILSDLIHSFPDDVKTIDQLGDDKFAVFHRLILRAM